MNAALVVFLIGGAAAAPTALQPSTDNVQAELSDESVGKHYHELKLSSRARWEKVKSVSKSSHLRVRSYSLEHHRPLVARSRPEPISYERLETRSRARELRLRQTNGTDNDKLAGELSEKISAHLYENALKANDEELELLDPGWNKATKAVKKSVKKTTKAINKAFKTTTKSTGKTFSKVASKTGAYLSTMATSFTNGVVSAADMAGDAVKDSMNTISVAVESVAETVIQNIPSPQPVLNFLNQYTSNVWEIPPKIEGLCDIVHKISNKCEVTVLPGVAVLPGSYVKFFWDYASLSSRVSYAARLRADLILKFEIDCNTAFEDEYEVEFPVASIGLAELALGVGYSVTVDAKTSGSILVTTPIDLKMSMGGGNGLDLASMLANGVQTSLKVGTPTFDFDLSGTIDMEIEIQTGVTGSILRVVEIGMSGALLAASQLTLEKKGGFSGDLEIGAEFEFSAEANFPSISLPPTGCGNPINIDEVFNWPFGVVYVIYDETLFATSVMSTRKLFATKEKAATKLALPMPAGHSITPSTRARTRRHKSFATEDEAKVATRLEKAAATRLVQPMPADNSTTPSTPARTDRLNYLRPSAHVHPRRRIERRS